MWWFKKKYRYEPKQITKILNTLYKTYSTTTLNNILNVDNSAFYLEVVTYANMVSFRIRLIDIESDTITKHNSFDVYYGTVDNTFYCGEFFNETDFALPALFDIMDKMNAKAESINQPKIDDEINQKNDRAELLNKIKASFA